MSELLAIGADGARGGWLAALAYGDPSGHVERVELQLAEHFSALTDLRAGTDINVAVDIPMGLLDSVELRPCDHAARSLLRARAASVFAAPSRPLLAAATYAQARELIEQTRLTMPEAKSLSAQAFGIAPRIREAEEYLQANAGAQMWLWECHPELSFRALAEGKVLRTKASVGGQAERLALLVERFPAVLDTLVAVTLDAREAEMADALDALVALDTALHVRAGDYEELGGETDATGLVMRMVF